RADVVLAEDAAGREQQREARPGLLVGRDVLGDDELAPAADEAVDVHDRRSFGMLLVDRPLDRADLVEPLPREAGKARRQPRDLVDDLAWVGVVPVDRKSTRLNSSHVKISYAVFCLKKKN